MMELSTSSLIFLVFCSAKTSLNVKQVFTIVVGSVFNIPIKSKQKTKELEEPLLEYDCIYQKKDKKKKDKKDKKKKSKKKKKKKKGKGDKSSSDTDTDSETAADVEWSALMSVHDTLRYLVWISQNRNGYWAYVSVFVMWL